MRHLIRFALAMLLTAFAAQGQQITLSLFWTNDVGVSNGSTITINGQTRMYTNNLAASPATLIRSTNSWGAAMSNTFTHFGLYSWPLLTLRTNGTNSLRLTGLPGGSLTFSVGGTWGYGVLTTNTTTAAQGLRLPITVYDPPTQTNYGSALVEAIQRATNSWGEGERALTNHLNLSAVQTFGNKRATNLHLTLSTLSNVFIMGATNFGVIRGGTNDGNTLTNALISGTVVSLTNGWFTNGTWSGGTLSNATIINAASVSGKILNVTNGWFWSPTNINLVMSNGANYGLAFRSPGTGAFSDQFGSNANASGDYSFAAGPDSAAWLWSFAGGYGAKATNAYTIAIGNNAVASGGNSVAITRGGSASGEASINVGAGTAGGYGDIVMGSGSESSGGKNILLGLTSETANSTNTFIVGSGLFGSALTNVVGLHALPSANNQIKLGPSSYSVSIPGRLEAAFQTNSTFAGTNKVMSTADWSWEHQTISTLANGVNFAIAFTNTAVILTAGPTADFSIDGISGNNRVGRFLILINRTGQNCTLARESGSEPTPANRIDTLTGTSITLRAGGSATLLYDATVSRWIVLGVNLGTDGFGAQSATNAIPFLNGSGTNTMFYTANGVTTPNLRIYATSAQQTNLTEWLNSSGTKLAFVSTNGGMVLGSDGIAPRTNDLVTSGALNLTVAGNSNVFLRAQGPGELALVNGTQPQTNHIYGTWSSSTSFERLRIGYNGGATDFMVASDAGSGGGTARGLTFGAAKNSGGGFTRHWNIPPTSGNFEGIDPTNSIILGARAMLRAGLSSGRLSLIAANGTASGVALQFGNTNGTAAMVTTNGHMAEWRTADNANLTSVVASNFIAGRSLVAAVAGGGLEVKEGSNARMGTAVLASGTASVSTTAVTANSRIFLTTQVMGATICLPYIHSRTAATSFVITNSVGTGGASTVAWMIVEPAP